MIPSILIILAHVFVLHLLRKAVRNSSKINDSLKEVLLSGICAFELGCVALEQGVLMEQAGFSVWALSLLLVVVWQVLGWDGVSPSPLPYILERSGQGLASALVMLACSLLSYRHMSTIWAAELGLFHRGRAQAISSGVCSLPWQHTDLYQVVLCELVGTLLLTLVPRLILESPVLANNDSSKLVRASLVSWVVLATVMLGMNTSGAMFNPTLAAVLVGGCKGFTTSQHLLVYWVVPLIGAAMGTGIHYRLTRPAIELKKKRS